MRSTFWTSIVAFAAGVTLALAGAWPIGVHAQTAVTLNTLANRSALVCNDEVPVLPYGGATLEQATACQVQSFALTSLNGFSGVDPTGATDSTAGIQAAINTGAKLFCNGLYKVSATLTFTSTVNHGQLLVGSGTSDQYAVTTAGRCIFRPTSALAGAVFKIDGSPFSGFVQSLGIENVTVDMTNMADVATNIAFQQIQAFDIHYRGDRVINFGNYKLSWYFSADSGGGSYTTLLDTVQGGIIDFQGLTFSNEATTITVINSDFTSVYHDYFENVTFIGGAIQVGYTTATPFIYVPPGPIVPIGYENANTTGFYAMALSQLVDSQEFQALGTDFEYTGGFTNTTGCSAGYYNDGTHGCLKAIPSFVINANATVTKLDHIGAAGMYVVDMGSSSTILGGNAGGGSDLDRFNTLTWFNANVWLTNGANVLCYSDNGVTQTCDLNASTGALTIQSALVKPATDGLNILQISNAGGSNLLAFATSTGQLGLNNYSSLEGYSDNGSTGLWQLHNVSGANGELNIYGASPITLNASNGTITGASLYATPVGNLSASTGAFTTLSASSTVSGIGFSNYLASPPAIGGTTAAAGAFTTLNATASASVNGKLIVSATAPTYSSGFSTGTPTIAGSTTGAFTVTIGATPGATGVLTMPAAATGWNCVGVDRTTAAGTIRETATATTSVTFALGSTVASDVLQFQCMAQ